MKPSLIQQLKQRASTVSEKHNEDTHSQTLSLAATLNHDRIRINLEYSRYLIAKSKALTDKAEEFFSGAMEPANIAQERLNRWS